MYTLSSFLHTYKTHNYTTHDTPELWRGAAGLCARVRACAGAAESLHTYMPIHTTHTCIQAQLKHTNTHTHTQKQPHPTLPTHLQHVRDTDVCRHQYRKRCAPTRRDALYNLLIYTYVYSSYMSCAWPGVCQRQPSLAGCADKSWSRRQRALRELDELEQQPGRRIHPHICSPLAAPVSWEKASAAEPVVRPGEGVHRAN